MPRKSLSPACAMCLAFLGLLVGCARGPSSSVPRAEAVSQSRPLMRVGNLNGNGPVYFVPLGNTPPVVAQGLASYYRQRLGLDAQVLGSIRVPVGLVDRDRKQVAAEDLIQLMYSRHREITSGSLIGIVDGDIYSRGSGFRFTFSVRQYGPDGGAAVVSYARMDPRFFGEPRDSELLHSRLRKMVTKNLGIVYYHLPESRDPKSALFSPVLGLDDLDHMGQGF